MLFFFCIFKETEFMDIIFTLLQPKTMHFTIFFFKLIEPSVAYLTTIDLAYFQPK